MLGEVFSVNEENPPKRMDVFLLKLWGKSPTQWWFVYMFLIAYPKPLGLMFFKRRVVSPPTSYPF